MKSATVRRRRKGSGDNIIPTTHHNVDVTNAPHSTWQHFSWVRRRTPEHLQSSLYASIRRLCHLLAMHRSSHPVRPLRQGHRGMLIMNEVGEVGHRAPEVWGASSEVWGASSSPLNVTNTPHGNHKHTHTVTQSHTHIESGLLMLLPTHVDSNAMDEWVAAAAVDQNFLSLSNLHVLDSNSKHCFIIATRPKDSTLTHKRRVRSRPQQVQHNFGTVSQSCMPRRTHGRLSCISWQSQSTRLYFR